MLANASRWSACVNRLYYYGFPFSLPDGIGAIAVVVDPAGHPVGLYSRTPLPPVPSPVK